MARTLALLALLLTAAEAWQQPALGARRASRRGAATRSVLLASAVPAPLDAPLDDVVCDTSDVEFCDPVPAERPAQQSDVQRMVKLGTLFGAWYALNVAYNIGNKLVLTALPIPWTAATVELFFGLVSAPPPARAQRRAPPLSAIPHTPSARARSSPTC